MKTRVIDGNEACARISYYFTEYAGVYPITPATPISEYVEKYSSKGEKNIFNDTVKLKEMQSEKGAIALVHGLLQTGTLASTYTASQGLIFMIPEMYKIAGEMLPCVINVASRSIATHALSIFGDHSDIYATRSTGFSFLASSNVQDVVYMTLISYLTAYKASMPFVNFFDGFRTSHEQSKVNILELKDIIDLLPLKEIKKFKDNSILVNKVITGTNQNDDIYFQNLEARNKDYERVPYVVNDYMNKINEKFHTNYKPFNYYGDPKATKIIVAMGSVCSSLKNLVDILNEKDEKVGVVEVHLFRPFSSKYLLDVIPKTVKKIAVLDRAKEASDLGEPLYLDVVSAVRNLKRKVTVIGGRYGISSKNTTLEDLNAVFKNLDSDNPIDSFTISINDDVTNKSLKPASITRKNNKTIEMLIYGFGSDGMVSASKDILKLIGDNTDAYVQGYSRYDSRKSGGVTISNLRISKEEINEEYYVENPHIVVCTNDTYMDKYNILYNIRKNGIFLLVTDKEDIDKSLSDNQKYLLAKNNIKFYIIDAYKIARENNIPNKISTITEKAIFYITKLLPDYSSKLEETIKNNFKNKGEEIVNNNLNSIKNIEDYIKEIEIKESWLKLDLSKKEHKNILDKINYLKGNNISISELLENKSGRFKTNTSKLFTNNLPEEVPFWKSDICIQCNKCSIVCPHGVIVPKILTDEEIKKNDKIVYTELMGKEGYKFALEFNYEKCTGCKICASTCIGKRGLKALEMSKPEYLLNKKIDSEYRNLFDKNTIKGLGFEKSLFKYPGACKGCGETSYIKLLTQIHNDGIVIANATGCSSIYGGSIDNNPYDISWSNSLFEDNAEYGYGMALSIKLKQDKIEEIMKNKLDNISSKNKVLFEKWIENKNNYSVTKEIMEEIDYDEVTELKKYKKYIATKSVWIVGGDGWSYDINFDGIDHVMASNANVNILVLDTEVYSNTGGQSSKATKIGTSAKLAINGKETYKKDLARMMMGYNNVYIATIALGANILQTMKVLKEASEHNGPSLIIAYSPCISHGIKTGLNSIEEEKLAVQSGYFPLFRYNNDKLTLDYKEPNFDLYEGFLKRENRFRNIDEEIFIKQKEEAIRKFKFYKNLEKQSSK